MLKIHQISSLFTSLTHEQPISYSSLAEEAISSLVDSWIKLRNEESESNRVRSLYIEKSRGMGHSSEIKDFLVTDQGIKIMNAGSPAALGQNGSGKAGMLSENGSKQKL